MNMPCRPNTGPRYEVPEPHPPSPVIAGKSKPWTFRWVLAAIVVCSLLSWYIGYAIALKSTNNAMSRHMAKQQAPSQSYPFDGSSISETVVCPDNTVYMIDYRGGAWMLKDGALSRVAVGAVPR